MVPSVSKKCETWANGSDAALFICRCGLIDDYGQHAGVASKETHGGDSRIVLRSRGKPDSAMSSQ